MPVRIAGKLVRVLPHGAFMESTPGVADVFIPEQIVGRHNLRAKKATGSWLLAEAEEHIQGQNKWRVTRIDKILEQGDMLSGETGHRAGADPSSRTRETSRQPAKPAQTLRIASVIDCINRLIQQSGGKMLVAQLTRELYDIQPGAKEELKAAGGLKQFCDLHSGRIQFVEIVRGGALQAVRCEQDGMPAVS
eukprot:1235886-Rhodomonas_salina.1